MRSPMRSTHAKPNRLEERGATMAGLRSIPRFRAVGGGTSGVGPFSLRTVWLLTVMHLCLVRSVHQSKISKEIYFHHSSESLHWVSDQSLQGRCDETRDAKSARGSTIRLVVLALRRWKTEIFAALRASKGLKTGRFGLRKSSNSSTQTLQTGHNWPCFPGEPAWDWQEGPDPPSPDFASGPGNRMKGRKTGVISIRLGR